jgi:dolichyl-phosphate-mannose-protein mannosyltransferase
VFFGIVVNFIRVLVKREFQSEVSIMLYGYLLSYLPFALIKRDMFIYHYAIPLIFGCCNMAILIERCLGPKLRGFCYCLVATSALIGFFLWCPWAYGLTTPEFWFLVWDRRWP